MDVVCVFMKNSYCFSKITPKYTKRPLQKGRFFCLKLDEKTLRLRSV
jgi:hypothetical protein